MVQTITPALTTLLKSKLQAGPAGGYRAKLEIDYVIPGYTSTGAEEDLALSLGTVTRDVSRHTFVHDDRYWINYTNVNDGSDVSYGYVASSPFAFTDYIVCDLGAAYLCSRFNILATNSPSVITDFQYSTDGTTWFSLTGVETGGRNTTPTGATFTFTAPISARYWAIKASATGFHSTLNLNRWSIFGVPTVDHPATIGTSTVRLNSATLDRSRKMAAAQFDGAINNEFENRGYYTGDGRTFIPNNVCRVYMTYGDPGTTDWVLVFTGLFDRVTEHRDPKNITIKARSRMKWLFEQSAAWYVLSPQGATDAGAVRTEDNGVYLNKTVEYIVGDILTRWGWPSADRVIDTTGVTVAEYDITPDMTGAAAIDGLNALTTLVNFDFWEDELGVAHFQQSPLFAGSTPAADYTFASGVDIMVLDHESDDEELATRVKVTGPMTSSVPTWTQEWSSSVLAHPTGMAYRASESGYVYAIDALTQYLSKIDQSTHKVVARWYLGGTLTYSPVGLSIDPTNSLYFYVLDGDWPFGGTTHAKVHRYRWSDKAHMDSTSLPDGEWSAMKFDGTHLWLTNYGDNNLYEKTYVGGGSAGATANFSYSGKTAPTGLWLDGTTIGIRFTTATTGAENFYLVDTSAPGTITGTQSTKGTSIFGGEMDLTTHADLYVDHYTSTSGSVAKYKLTDTVTTDVVAWAYDQALEDTLGFQSQIANRVHDLHSGDPAHPWEARTATYAMQVVQSLAQAQAVAAAQLAALEQVRRILDLGILGNPAIQINDVLAITEPVTGLPTTWVLDTYRWQMDPTNGYVGSLSALPWVAP